MKKTMVLLLLATAPLLAICQLEKGKWLLGGSVAGNISSRIFEDFNSVNKLTVTNINLRPKIAKVLNKGWMVAAGPYWQEDTQRPNKNSNTPFRNIQFRNLGLVASATKMIKLKGNFYWMNELQISAGHLRRSETTQIPGNLNISIVKGLEYKLQSNPFGLCYIFNNRWIFRVDLLSVSYGLRNYYDFKNFGPVPDVQQDEGVVSMNPFQNGFTIYKILKK